MVGVGSGLVAEVAVTSVSADTADNYARCKPEDMPLLQSEDMHPDNAVVGTIPPSGGTTQPSANGTTSGDADTDLL